MWRVYSIRNWMFILHRVTGTVLLLYFVAHVLSISTALTRGPEAFTSLMALFHQPAFRVVELVVLGCVAFHGLNGLHLIAAERGWMRPEGRLAPRATVAVTLGIWGFAALLAASRWGGA